MSVIGTNFVSGHTYSLSFGGTTATGTYVDTTHLSATAPAHAAGAVSVTVTDTTTSTAGTGSASFTYLSPPTMTAAFSPTSISTAQTSTLTMTITNPNSATTLTGVALGSSSLPAGLTGSSPSTTCTSGTASYSSGSFSLSGGSIAGGASCTVTLTVTPTSAATNNFTSGNVSASGPISLTGTSASASLTVTAASPTISLISPSEGASGASAPANVTITGTGFGADAAHNAVLVGAGSATVVSASPTSITFTPQAFGGGGQFDVRVTNTTSGLSTTVTNGYTYILAPVSSASFSPSSFVAGTSSGSQLTIRLSNLNDVDLKGVAIGSVAFDSHLTPSITSNSCNGTATLSGNAFSYSGGRIYASDLCSIQIKLVSSTAGTYGYTLGTITSAGTDATALSLSRAGASAGTLTVTSADPTVTSISPANGTIDGGASVTITGTNFTGVTGIAFGANAATGVSCGSATSCTATAPAGTGTVDVTVTNGAGTSATSSADEFTYVAPPTVSASFSPTTVAIGAPSTLSVTITNPNSVQLDGITFFSALPSGLNFVVSSDTLNCVGNLSGGGFASYNTTNLAAVNLSLAANGHCTLTFQTVAASAASYTYSTGQITATGTPAASFSLTGAGASTPTPLDVTPPAPTVTGVAPNSGSADGGTSVTITGTDFTGATAVKFGSTSASGFTVVDDSHITVASPSGSAGTVDVTVTTPGGSSVTGSADQFTYIPTPVVTSISPTSGPESGGTKVTLTGSNFTDATAVTFGGTPASGFGVTSATSLTATAPAGTGTVDIRVTTDGGTSATGAGDQFTYIGRPTVTGLSPASGPESGGTVVTVSGTGFTTATAVEFGATAATGVTVNNDSELVATAPAGTGTVDVKVTNLGGTSAKTAPDAYSYVAPPSLSLSLGSSGTPRQGGAFDLTPTITNTGGDSTSGNLALTSSLPTGLTYASASGTNWDCSASSGGSLSCAFSGTLAASDSDSGLTVTVNVAADAATSLSPTFVVSGGGAGSSANGTTTVTVAQVPASVTADAGDNQSAAINADFGTPMRVIVKDAGGVVIPGASITFTANANAGATGAFGGSGNSTVTTDGSGVATAGTFTAGGTTGSYTVTATPATGSGSATFNLTNNPIPQLTIDDVTLSEGNAGITTFTFTVSLSSPANAGGVTFDIATADGTAVQPGDYAQKALTSQTIPEGSSSYSFNVLVAGDTGFEPNETFFVNVGNVTGATVSDGQGVGTINNDDLAPPALAANYAAGAQPYNSPDNPVHGTFSVAGTVQSGTPTGWTISAEPGGTFGSSSATHKAGSVTIDSNGTVDYTAPSGYRGGDSFVVKASNAAGASNESLVTVSVGNPTLTIALSGSGVRGTALSGVAVAVSGGKAPYSCSITSGSLPSGVLFFPGNCTFAGTPTASGNYNLQFNVTDSSTGTGPFTQASGTLTLRIAPPAPTVSTISPAAGPLVGGTPVTINGADFTGATGVTIGGNAATGVTVVSDERITATAPSGTAGAQDVAVTTPNGTGTLTGGFTYVAAPAVSSISPATGPASGGTTVTITGTGLSGAAAVTFGGTAATGFTVDSATQITATAPAGIGTVDVRVTTAGGTSATGSADQFAYVSAPTVSSISPATGPASGGTTVTITGTKFSSATAVSFGGTAATGFTVNADTQITATAPAGSGTVDVRVTTIGGTSATGSADRYTYVAVPAVTSLSPNEGTVAGGTSVVVTGSNLSGATAVSFGGVPATSFTVNSGTQITAVAPANGGTVNVTVTTPGGTSATGSGTVYTYRLAPTLSTRTPTQGPTTGGTSVVLTGTGLTGTTSVTFGGTAVASFTVDSPTQITAVTAPHAEGIADIVVTTPFGTNTMSSAYFYAAPPAVTSILPASGPEAGGTPVSITGTGFAAVTGVTFGGTPATSFGTSSSTNLSATAPPGTGTVDIVVTTAAGGPSAAVAADRFTYAAVPTVTSIAPATGPTSGGTTVVLTGTGFTGATAVSFGGTAATGFTVNSATQITATAPAGSGTVDIRVITGGGTSATGAFDQFAYVAAPTVTELSPVAGPTTGGTAVVLTGTNFTGATAVSFGGTAATSFSVDSPTKIRATAPAGTQGNVFVTVTTLGGTSATSSANRYSYFNAPTVTAVAPAAGGTAGGTSVTITGTDFVTVNEVRFGGVSAPFEFRSPTEIAALSPAHAAGTVDVVVTTYGGSSATGSADHFLYVAPPGAPTITSPAEGAVVDSLTPTFVGTAQAGTTVTIVIDGASVGTASAAGGNWSYTPGTPMATGAHTIRAAATDGVGNVSPDSATVNFSITPAPVAADRSGVAIPYQTPTQIDLSASITGVHSSIAIGTAPTHGTTSIAGDVVTYTPAAGYFGADSFTYTATGTGGTSPPATVSLTVATPAAPTVAAKSGVAVPYNGAGTAVDLSASITGVHSSIAIASAPAHGTTSVAGDVVTYTPTTGYFGADSFTYTATGPGGTSDPASVSLTVATPAAPTVANKLGVAVGYNSSGAAIDLSASVTGVHSSIAVAMSPAHGTASVAGDVVTYTPTAGYFGADSFTYTATGPGGTSDPATVSLTVATPAAPTVANKSGVGVAYNSSGAAIDLSASVTGVHSSIAVANAPQHGTTSIAGDVVTYTPTAGYFGADSFTYTATGPGGTSDPATVSLTVATPAAPTVANKSGVAVGYNSSGTAIDLSASVSGVHSSIAVATSPAHGTTSVAGDVITYTPTAGYFGADSFTYTATGPGGTSDSATVSLTVAPPAAPTVANKTGVAVGYNSSGTAVDLAASVTGVHSSIAVATAPQHGTTSIAGDVVTYTPAAGYFGADSFTYAATGPGGTSDPATVSLTVATPAAPTAADKAGVAVAYGTATAIDLSASVTGVHTSLAVAGAPAHGTTSIAGDVVTYTPAAGYAGADSFTYTATGPGGTSSPATVTLNVTAPSVTITSDALPNGQKGQAYSVTLAAGGGTQPYSFKLSAGTLPQGLTLSSGGVLAGTPTEFGSFPITVAATDSSTGTGPFTGSRAYTLTIAPPPAPVAVEGPTATVASSTITNNQSVDVNLSSLVTGEYTDIQIGTAPQHGTATIHGQGVTAQSFSPAAVARSFVATYVPNTGFHGSDSFTFVAIGPGGRSEATVRITVTGLKPVAPALTATTTAGVPVTVDLTSTASEAPFTSAAILSVTPADKASARLIEGGTAQARTYRLEIQSDGHFGGTVTVSYTLTNAFGTSDPATVTLTVNARPDPAADPTVRALSDAEVEAARRFGQLQIENFQQRNEQLHDGGNSSQGNAIGMRLTGGDRMVRERPGTYIEIPDAVALKMEHAMATVGSDRARGLRALAGAGGFDQDSPGAMLSGLRSAGTATAMGARAAPAPGSRAGEDDEGGRRIGSAAIWSGGAIELGVRDETTKRRKLSLTSAGLSTGVDIKFAQNLILGVGGGYGSEHTDVGDDKGRMDARNWVGAFYGSYRPGEGAFVDFIGGFGQLDFRTRRVAANGQTALGSRDGTLRFGSLSAGYQGSGDLWRLSAYGRFDYVGAQLNTFSETGAGIYNLRFDRRDVDSFSTVLGGRAEFGIDTDAGLLSPRGRFEWRHEFNDAGVQRLDFADLTGSSYRIVGDGWLRDEFSLELGLGIRMHRGWTWGFDVGGRLGQGSSSATLKTTITKEF